MKDSQNDWRNGTRRLSDRRELRWTVKIDELIHQESVLSEDLAPGNP